MLESTKSEKMKLVNELLEYRLENKLSLQALSKKVGVHYVTLHQWFTGKRKPNMIQTYHIRKFLEENQR